MALMEEYRKKSDTKSDVKNTMISKYTSIKHKMTSKKHIKINITKTGHKYQCTTSINLHYQSGNIA